MLFSKLPIVAVCVYGFIVELFGKKELFFAPEREYICGEWEERAFKGKSTQRQRRVPTR